VSLLAIAVCQTHHCSMKHRYREQAHSYSGDMCCAGAMMAIQFQLSSSR
jgi:hypothetical protein